MMSATVQRRLLSRIASSSLSSSSSSSSSSLTVMAQRELLLSIRTKRSFTGAALSDAAYFRVPREEEVVVVDEVDVYPPSLLSEIKEAAATTATTTTTMTTGGLAGMPPPTSADFSSLYASNDFLSPCLRRQLDLTPTPPSGDAVASSIEAVDASSAPSATDHRLLQQQQHRPKATPMTMTQSQSTMQLHKDFEEEERLLIQQRAATMHTLAMADDDVAAAELQTATDTATAGEGCCHAAEDSIPLPRTFASATHPSESRAVVVTEPVAPFRIVHVNTSWEDLCGHSRSYACGRTLGELLSGPETDEAASTALVNALLRGEEDVGTVMTNYRAGGAKFRNRVRVSPLRREEEEEKEKEEGKNGEGARSKSWKSQVTHFVAVLREIPMTPSSKSQ